jgi:2-methylisocitrate lyase-like PEP mutase family enzyme
MQSGEARQRADQFFALHSGPRPLVLIHAWDAGSARALEQSGAKAVGTTTAGIAWSLGFAEGERVPIAEFVAACDRICRAVSVPVLIELPACVMTDEETCVLIRQLIMLGVVALTIREQPSSLPGRIAKVRSFARDVEARLFINARIDDERYDAAFERARQCVEAGADGVSVRALGGYDIVRLTRAVTVPVDVDIGDGWGLPIHGLALAGVRRISLEQTPINATIGLVRRIAKDVFAGHHPHNLNPTHRAS